MEARIIPPASVAAAAAAAATATASATIASASEPEFNAILFEKKLMQLKDSQESINTMSHWCLEHRMHHKKIVIAWLSVLKKVKVEQRLTLFYLANDVIQYSKRKNYDFVESWGTTLQKATTLVREEKVKNRILRIFKIWEQRGIYGEEFIADLSGLISASPSAQKLNQDPQDFQPTYLINRIRSCAKLEADTDLKLKNLKDSNPKITDSETLCASLKDRRHVEDVEKEVESGITLFEGYVNALKAEIKSRTHLISCLTQADTFYHEERKEVKVVVNAYKNFTSRVKNLQKKLQELTPNLTSPIPSPDVNAPSPEPDSDVDLPTNSDETNIKCAVAAGVSVFSVTDTYSANYYTPAVAATTQNNQDNFSNNGFSSFMGSNMPFDLQNFNTSNIFSEQSHQDNYNAQPPQTQSISYDQRIKQTCDPNLTSYNTSVTNSYNHQPIVYNPPPQQPLLPPPMPPFTSSYMETAPYSDATYAAAAAPIATDSYVNNSNYEPVMSAQYAVSASEIQAPYVPPADAYNPEEEIETWEPEAAWDAPPDQETPESPPMFEKESFVEPIEYDDSKNSHIGLLKDVDHRVLLPPPQIPHDLTGEDTDLRMSHMGGPKDVDHRNLISLTGSPTNDSPGLLQPPPAPPSLWSEIGDQDYRNNQDQDYRDIARQLKLPPPPPPPTKALLTSPYKRTQHPGHDNVESIDMELSDDENTNTNLINTNSDCMNGSSRNIVTLVANHQHQHQQQMDCPPPMPNGPPLTMMGPPIHMNPNWPPPDFGERQPQFRPNFPPPPPNKFEFRGGFGPRGGRGRIDSTGFRGRGGGGPRSRPMFRGGPNGRGNFNNRASFRGKFRGSF